MGDHTQAIQATGTNDPDTRPYPSNPSPQRHDSAVNPDEHASGDDLTPGVSTGLFSAHNRTGHSFRNTDGPIESKAFDLTLKV